MVRKRVIVRGRVQGVGFRWATQAEAERCGVSGSVRNLPDGTVEADIEGDDGAVQRMLDWLQHGPPFAEVGGVEVVDLESADRDRSDNRRASTSNGNSFRIS